MLGSARQVTVDKDNTTIVDGRGDKADIEARVEQIRRLIEETTSDFDREKYQERLAKLAGGVAVLQVGAATETELTERNTASKTLSLQPRLQLKKASSPAAAPLSSTSCQPRSHRHGRSRRPDRCQHCQESLEAPVRQIAENAGVEGSVVCEHVKALPVGEATTPARMSTKT